MMEQRKQQLMQENGGPEWLTRLRDQYHNEGLERFVRRSNDIFSNRVIHYKDELIQKFDPIFEDPQHPFIKAHFLTSTKNFAGLAINTYQVNLIVIWILNTILFILLYTAFFQKFSHWASQKVRLKWKAGSEHKQTPQ